MSRAIERCAGRLNSMKISKAGSVKLKIFGKISDLATFFPSNSIQFKKKWFNRVDSECQLLLLCRRNGWPLERGRMGVAWLIIYSNFWLLRPFSFLSSILVSAVAPSDNNRPPDVGLVDCFIVRCDISVAATSVDSTTWIMQINDLCWSLTVQGHVECRSVR